MELGHIKIFNDWKPWFNNINELIDTADIIEGVRFVKLKHVLKWKKNMNRTKDQEYIKLIEQHTKKR